MLLSLTAGLVTQFYLALLSKRALTMVTYDDLPPFESACIAPYFNFTHPDIFPTDAINPVKTFGWNGESSACVTIARPPLFNPTNPKLLSVVQDHDSSLPGAA